MAVGNKSIYKNYVYVDVAKNNIPLIVNNVNHIDFISEVTNNQPNGYTFDHLEYLGSWPATTWDSGLVTRVYAHDLEKRSLSVTTRAAQNYRIKVRIWYRR